MQLHYHALTSLKEVRQLLHYRAEELAKRLAITTTSYMRHERGERRMYWDKVLTIANKLNVDPRIFSRVLTLEDRQLLVAQGERRRQIIEQAKLKGLSLETVDRMLIHIEPTPEVTPTNLISTQEPPAPGADWRKLSMDERLARLNQRHEEGNWADDDKEAADVLLKQLTDSWSDPE